MGIEDKLARENTELLVTRMVYAARQIENGHPPEVLREESGISKADCIKGFRIALQSYKGLPEGDPIKERVGRMGYNLEQALQIVIQYINAH